LPFAVPARASLGRDDDLSEPAWIAAAAKAASR